MVGQDTILVFNRIGSSEDDLAISCSIGAAVPLRLQAKNSHGLGLLGGDDHSNADDKSVLNDDDQARFSAATDAPVVRESRYVRWQPPGW
jgi:hypothetical protein